MNQLRRNLWRGSVLRSPKNADGIAVQFFLADANGGDDGESVTQFAESATESENVVI